MPNSSNLLGSGNSPYVHSRYENFLKYKGAVSRYAQKKEGAPIIKDKLSNLRKLSESLKSAVKAFLGNEKIEDSYTAEEFLKIMGENLGYDLKFGLLFKDFIQSTHFYSYAAYEVGKERKRRIREMFPQFDNKIGELDPLEVAGMSNETIGQLVFELIIGDKESIKQEDFLKELSKLPDNIKKRLPKQITKETSDKTMKKIISKINQGFNESRKNFTNELSFKTLIERFCGPSGEKFKSYLLQRGYNITDIDFDSRYKILRAKLENVLSEVYIGINKTKIGATRGEELFKAVFSTIGEEGFQIEVMGADTQENAENFAKSLRGEIENEITQEKYGSTRNQKKMASFDLLIKNNKLTNNKNAVIGVQSKNYNDFYSEIIDSGKTEQFIKIFNTTKDTKTVGGFVNLLADRGYLVERESLIYTLANMIWFSCGGAITNEDDKILAKKINVTDMGELIEELNVVIASFLGVQFSKQFEVIPHITNGFWLLNNTYLIPTYFIIDKLIEIAEQKYNEMFVSGKPPISLSVSGFCNYKTNLKDVTDFYNQKIAAKDGDNISSTITNIGTQKGAEIIASNLKMKSVGLTFDLENTLLTSFRF